MNKIKKESTNSTHLRILNIFWVSVMKYLKDFKKNICFFNFSAFDRIK